MSNYRIAGKFGRELSTAIWQSTFATTNLNSPISFLQWQFWAQQPNLIPASISGYIVYSMLNKVITVESNYGHAYYVYLNVCS